MCRKGVFLLSRRTNTIDSERIRKLANALTEAAVGIAVVAVIVTSGILVVQNRSLHRDLEEATRAPAPPEVTVGKSLSGPLAAATTDGGFRELQWPDTESDRMLVITFSPGCPACQANQAGWALVAKGIAARQHWRVLWVSRDPVPITREYAQAERLQLADVVADPTHRTYMQLALQGVPNTMVVGVRGVIERVWPGRLDSAKWKEVFAYFGMPAPAVLGSNEAVSASTR